MDTKACCCEWLCAELRHGRGQKGAGPKHQEGAQKEGDPRHQEGIQKEACPGHQAGVQKEGVPRREAVDQKAGVLQVGPEHLQGQQVGLPRAVSRRMRVWMSAQPPRASLQEGGG